MLAQVIWWRALYSMQITRCLYAYVDGYYLPYGKGWAVRGWWLGSRSFGMGWNMITGFRDHIDRGLNGSGMMWMRVTRSR
jgi:hypothetical protein